MDNLESDFWKEHFVHLLHKNMIRTNAKILNLEDVPQVFENFSLQHPEYQIDFHIEKTYATWEVFVTKTVKLRLFIQNQIKASLLQKDGNDFVKIADAKFPYNPFYEISEFLSNKEKFDVELYHKKEEKLKKQRKMQIAKEFIKANLKEKYKNNSEVFWTLKDCENEKIKLILQKNNKSKEIILSTENFLSEIETSQNIL